jgi:hypothetical protein
MRSTLEATRTFVLQIEHHQLEGFLCQEPIPLKGMGLRNG